MKSIWKIWVWYISQINGQIYTEAIDIGKEPITNHFGDLVKVFTGTMETYKSLGKY